MEGTHRMLSYFVIGVFLILEATGQHHIPFGTRTVAMNRNRLAHALPGNGANGMPSQNLEDTAHHHPKILSLEAQCFPDGMSLTVEFDSAFSGIVYSKGHFGSPNCRFVQANSAGASRLAFGVPANDCGTKENQFSKTLSNVLVFQMDEDVQEVWDIARQVSCSSGNPNKKNGDSHTKMVVFKPLSVGMLDVQHHPIKSEGLDCWMDIQVGKYPNTTPIQGQLPIGEELSILIFMKDEERQYDVRVQDCWAFDMESFEDSKTSKVQLTGYDGCPRKVKLIGPWDKTFDTGDSGATTIAFTNMTAFKFPDSDNVHLSCNIELCRGVCEQDTCGRGPLAISAAPAGPFRGTTGYPTARPTPYQGPGYSAAPPSQSSQPTNGYEERPPAPTPSIPDQEPLCYEGSYDPRCQSTSGRNASEEFPVACPPGSLDPACLENPDQAQDLIQDDITKGYPESDEKEDEILGNGYQPTTTSSPYQYEFQTTPPPYRRPTVTQRAPLCYPGQPDPRCPGSYPSKPSGTTSRPSFNYQTEQTTKKIQTPTAYPQGPSRKPAPTSRPVQCYPGQIDPRCPKPEPSPQSTSGYGENEGLIEQEEYYTSTQSPDEQPKTTIYDIRAPPAKFSPSVYQSTPKKSEKYETEGETENAYFTTTQKPYQYQNYQTTTRIPPYQYPTTARVPQYQYPTTTKQPVRYQSQPTTPRTRIPVTTPKVVCYPGQPDPRCPGSYPQSQKQQPTPPSRLYDFPPAGTTLKPYVPSTPPRKVATPDYSPRPLKSSTPKPCYRGDPGCAKYATTTTTTTAKYESEDNYGNTYVSPTTRSPYQYPTATKAPYTYPQPASTPKQIPSPTNGKKQSAATPPPQTQPPRGTYQQEEIAHTEFESDPKGDYNPSAPTQGMDYPEAPYEPFPTPSRKPYGPEPSEYENIREPGPYQPYPSQPQPQPQEGYNYKPPTGKPFQYETGAKKPNGYPATGNGNGYQAQGGNGYAPTPGSNGKGRTTPRPVVCYPGQIDPRCPKVCYEGSTDRRCMTRKRETNQVICFADSTDPRCPKFN